MREDAPDALADALRRLRDDPALRERLAEAGRRCYERRHTPQAAAESLLGALSARGLLP